MLEIGALTWTTSGRRIVSDVSFTVPRAAVLAVLGPSGSGKSSLLRLLAGLETPSAGTVRWCGVTLSEAGRVRVPPEQRRFGLVFQDPSLFPHLTVEENVAFGLPGRGPSRRSRAEHWLGRLGIRNLGRGDVSLLSGGERQRVALARALAAEPEVLLLDEPFNNVDRLARDELLVDLHQIMTETKTTGILVTHDTRDTWAMSDDYLLLTEGRIVRQGPVEALKAPGDGQDWADRFLGAGVRPLSARKGLS